MGLLSFGATREWRDGSDQRLWLGGYRKDEHLGIESCGNGAAREQSLKRGEMGRAEWVRGEGDVAFVEEGQLSQSCGGQGGGGRQPREEVKAEEEGGIHGNKSGLREIRLPESE